ncbi:MAG TPA: serine hydrolase domain-containing protein [Chthoniobacterales bacterium]|jgi:Beta-lactamase class C and other penicillin binding proteins|nr:serine hydrolase domain-containing protein [Chthoniobacterales bacterium]
MQKPAFGFAAILIAAATAYAQGPAPSPLISLPSPPPAKAPPAAPQTTPAPALTKEDFETFLDALIPSQLQNRNIAGAVVSVVKDGQVLFQKGYGYADVEAKKPVLPDQTLFRPGSISKLFTATAVMQLVEQGKLDLDRDVNDYLDFPIPKTYPEPVTLRRLLTHTAGFEETLKNLFVARESDMKALRTYLVNQMPARIYPPGKVPSYSNYGFSVAGYIVERVSGEKFERYVDNHILKPLRMDSSTFDQPLPAPLAAQMSKGYREASKKPRNFEFVQAAPAGSLSTTAADMTRFMLAFLQNGSVDGVSILKPETVQQMQTRQFELNPMICGLGITFMEYWLSPVGVIGHGGDSVYFHSDMVLVPDAHVGYFLSYNTLGKAVGGGRGEVQRAFINRYFPNPAEPKIDIDANTAKADGLAVTGVYDGTRRSDTTFLRMIALLSQFGVKSDKDGVITVEENKNQRGELKKFKEIAPLVYAEIGGPERIAFRKDASGNVAEMLPYPAIYEGQRVPWYNNKRLITPVIGGNLLLVALTVLLWPVAAVVRKRYQRPLFTSKVDRALYFLSRVVCIAELILILAPAIALSQGLDHVVILGNAIDPWLSALHILGWAVLAGIVLLVVVAVRFAKLPGHGLWFRAHAILLALGGIAFGLFVWQCHLLGPSLKF